MKAVNWPTVFTTIGIVIALNVLFYSKPSNAWGSISGSADRMASALERIAKVLEDKR